MGSHFLMPWTSQGPVKLHRGERQDIVPQRNKAMDRFRTLASRAADRFGDLRSRKSDSNHRKPPKQQQSPRRKFTTYGEDDIFINPFGMTMKPEKHFGNSWEKINPVEGNKKTMPPEVPKMKNNMVDDVYDHLVEPPTHHHHQEIAREALGIKPKTVEDYYTDGYHPEPAGEFTPSQMTTNYDALYYLARCGRSEMFTTVWMHYRQVHGQGDILHKACKQGHYEMADHLLRNPIDVDLLDPDGASAIYFAVDGGYVDIVRMLLDKYPVTDVNESVEPGKTILYTAAKRGYVEIVKMTLTHGVNLHEVGEYEYTPLHVAADTGNCDMVRALLDKGAKIDSITKSDRTAFEVAVHNKEFDAARILVERGSNVERLDEYGRSILHWAAGSSDEKTVAFLLDCGSSPNLVNKTGTMPHHVAARHGRCLNLHILLTRGARLNATRSLDRGTPTQMALMDALDARKYPCIVVLLMHGADVATPRDDETDLLLRVANIYGHDPKSFGAHVIEAFLFSGHIRFITRAIKDVVSKMSMYFDLGSWYKHVLSRPLSLKNLCRVAMRRQLMKHALGTSIWGDVHSLDIDQNLRDFLLLRECDMDRITETNIDEYRQKEQL